MDYNEIFVRVSTVEIEPWHTVGTCRGVEVETGDNVIFHAEARYCYDLQEAANSAQANDEDLPVASVAPYLVLLRSTAAIAQGNEKELEKAL